MTQDVQVGNILVLADSNPHIRKTRDDTTVKLDMNSGIFTMDMWVCHDGPGPVLSWKGQ